jgi:hypothetical protein
MIPARLKALFTPLSAAAFSNPQAILISFEVWSFKPR